MEAVATDNTTILIIALFAVIIIAAFLVFRQRAKVSIDRTGLKIDASNEPTPGVKADGVTAKGTVNARDELGGGVDAKNIKAGQDVNLINTTKQNPKA